MAGATNTTVTEVLLHDSYHVATIDNDAPQIFSGSIDFIESIAALPVPHQRRRRTLRRRCRSRERGEGTAQR